MPSGVFLIFQILKESDTKIIQLCAENSSHPPKPAILQFQFNSPQNSCTRVFRKDEFSEAGIWKNLPPKFLQKFFVFPNKNRLVLAEFKALEGTTFSFEWTCQVDFTDKIENFFQYKNERMKEKIEENSDEQFIDTEFPPVETSLYIDPTDIPKSKTTQFL
jgi:hypothetical protein